MALQVKPIPRRIAKVSDLEGATIGTRVLVIDTSGWNREGVLTYLHHEDKSFATIHIVTAVTKNLISLKPYSLTEENVAYPHCIHYIKPNDKEFSRYSQLIKESERGIL